MENVSTPLVPVKVQQPIKTPIFIDFSPEYAREHGISNEVDRMPKKGFERSPECDCFGNDNMSQFVGANYAALKAPSPAEIVKGMAVIPVILETGKQILIGIFDLRDIWTDRTGSKNQHNLKAMILPDEIADAITGKGINPNEAN